MTTTITEERISTPQATSSRTGFAAMDPDRQRQIASKGGKAAHEKGTAHEFTTEKAKVAGRKGGQSVSRDRAHMAEIGRRGGATVASRDGHMGAIGRKGGAKVAESREHMAEIGRVGGEVTATAKREHAAQQAKGGAT
jgi:general stress protein YciG